MQLSIRPLTLRFTFAARTSRGALTEKTSYLLRLTDPANPSRDGLGEVGPLAGLSPDHGPALPAALDALAPRLTPLSVGQIDVEALVPFAQPAVRFGLETALRDYQTGGRRQLYDNAFSQGKAALPINGLIWMGPADFMSRQVTEKLDAGFTCLKLKIGALDLDAELSILRDLRRRFSSDTLTLRVDANGAFTPAEAPAVLDQLAALRVHSIEQPIAAGQPAAMSQLCAHTPVPIALDEELIGAPDPAALLADVKPQYIILKPTLVGGLAASRRWIAAAEAAGVGWWVTSALESNVGLNAIAQFTAEYPVSLPQGLGTGQLYHRNVRAPLTVAAGEIRYDPTQPWDNWDTLGAAFA